MRNMGQIYRDIFKRLNEGYPAAMLTYLPKGTGQPTKEAPDLIKDLPFKNVKTHIVQSDDFFVAHPVNLSYIFDRNQWFHRIPLPIIPALFAH